MAINFNHATNTISPSNTNGNLVLVPDGTGSVPITNISVSSGTIGGTRNNPRVYSTASASSLTPDIASYDIYAFTALAANLTIAAPIGTPLDGNKLVFRFLDNGTSRTLSWNAIYRNIGINAPTATSTNKMMYVGCIYNAANTKWDVIAVNIEI